MIIRFKIKENFLALAWQNHKQGFWSANSFLGTYKFGNRDGGLVNSAHEQPSKNNLVEVGVGSSCQESVELLRNLNLLNGRSLFLF